MDPHEHARGNESSSVDGPVERPVDGLVIGLSASVPPADHLETRGLTAAGFVRTVAHVVVSLVEAGAVVRYAGDDRPGGVTTAIDEALGDAERRGRFEAVRRSAATDDLDEIRAAVVEGADVWLAIGGDLAPDQRSGVVDEVGRAAARRIPVVLATGFGGATAGLDPSSMAPPATVTSTSSTDVAPLVEHVVQVARDASTRGER